MKYQVCRPLTDSEYQELKESIADKGILTPVEVDENGAILDGHHRVQAWQELRADGVDVPDYARMIRSGMSEDEKLQHASMLNSARRQMTRTDRELLADRVKKLHHEGKTLQEIADEVGVGKSTVHRDLADSAFPTGGKAESVVGKDGKSYPQTYAPRKPKPPQGSIFAANAGDQKTATRLSSTVSHLTNGTATMSELKRIAKDERSDQRREAAQDVANLPDRTYNVIYADPPWQYSNTGVHGAADHHYDTMSIEQLNELPSKINLHIADNAVLFLWITNPLIAEAFHLIERWGFAYKTNMVWIKTELQKPGSGFYVRGRHEFLFICTRGSFTPLDQNISPPIGSVVEAAIQEHSRKPTLFYEIIERLYPQCSYVELFARAQREGWDVYGNQTERY